MEGGAEDMDANLIDIPISSIPKTIAKCDSINLQRMCIDLQVDQEMPELTQGDSCNERIMPVERVPSFFSYLENADKGVGIHLPLACSHAGLADMGVEERHPAEDYSNLWTLREMSFTELLTLHDPSVVNYMPSFSFQADTPQLPSISEAGRTSMAYNPSRDVPRKYLLL